MKPTVFISHVQSESHLAVWVKDTMDDLLLGGVNFFVSSDRNAIIGGDKWLEKIEVALRKSSIVLVLCSESSILRPWINFEAGGAWMADKRVIPICHGGMIPSNLPQPLASLQAYVLSNADDFKSLVVILAETAGLKVPQYDPYELLKSLPPTSVASDDESVGATAKIGTQGNSSGKIDNFEIRALRSNYTFDKRTGISRQNMTDEPVCTSCLLKGIESPLTESEQGWKCNNGECDKFYMNPNYNPPGTYDMEDDW